MFNKRSTHFFLHLVLKSLCSVHKIHLNLPVAGWMATTLAPWVMRFMTQPPTGGLPFSPSPKSQKHSTTPIQKVIFDLKCS